MMKYFRWKYLHKAVLWCLLLFLLWEIYYVLHPTILNGSTVMNRFIGKVYPEDHEAREIHKAAATVTSPLLNTSNPDELKMIVGELNSKQYVRNGNRLGLQLNKDSVVIIVQVHDRLTELKYLIESLERARFISKCLVIFSHDVYSEEINDAVRSILSFPVLQIYYPYSLQLYPSSFPGQDPDDCPREMPPTRKRKCNNINHPDSYGHYREAKTSQIKLHWLWQLYYVIEEVKILKDFTGTFLRLDEDYYISEDAIQVLHEMNRLNSETGQFKMMVLGDYDDIAAWSYNRMASMIRRRRWQVGVGRGMAFGRPLWEELKDCSHIFCTYDDYNWDWALQETVKRCMGGTLNVLQPSMGRVFHAGLCHGFHRNFPDCSTKDIIRKINKLLLQNEEFLFPKVMYLTENIEIDFGSSTVNGGWADPRDHRLCKSLLDGKGQVQETIRSINKQKII